MMAKKKAAKPLLPSELQSQLRRAQLELEQVYEYKAILKEDGLQPDADDKAKESRLLLRVRQLEKKLSGKWVPDEEYRGAGRPLKGKRPAAQSASSAKKRSGR